MANKSQRYYWAQRLKRAMRQEEEEEEEEYFTYLVHGQTVYETVLCFQQRYRSLSIYFLISINARLVGCSLFLSCIFITASGSLWIDSSLVRINPRLSGTEHLLHSTPVDVISRQDSGIARDAIGRLLLRGYYVMPSFHSMKRWLAWELDWTDSSDGFKSTTPALLYAGIGVTYEGYQYPPLFELGGTVPPLFRTQVENNLLSSEAICGDQITLKPFSAWLRPGPHHQRAHVSSRFPSMRSLREACRANVTTIVYPGHLRS